MIYGEESDVQGPSSMSASASGTWSLPLVFYLGIRGGMECWE